MSGKYIWIENDKVTISSRYYKSQSSYVYSNQSISVAELEQHKIR